MTAVLGMGLWLEHASAAESVSAAGAAMPGGVGGPPAYTRATRPSRQPYYFVPENVETYPWYGGVPTYRWGYFGASRHRERVGPHVGHNADYREKAIWPGRP